MRRKIKLVVPILLILGEIIMQRYTRSFKINPDLLYLILVYICVTGGFIKSIAAGTIIGLITDYLSVNIFGVFGFSRTLSAFIINDLSKRIDLKNNLFIFLMIFISLFLSNSIANIFFHFILGFGLNINMVLYQPFLTSLIGLAIIGTSKAKVYFDVY